MSENDFLKTFGRRPLYYNLINKLPVPVEDIVDWDVELKDRIIKQETIQDIFISTVFLGIDHAVFGKPILFETMIFGGELNEYQTRCCTYDEAEEMHQDAVEKVKLTINK